MTSRQRTFGGEDTGRIDDLPNATTASSFLSQVGRNFITPPGLDISVVAEHGSAILLAWAGDYSPVKPLYQFSPRRAHRNTLWRMAVPVRSPQSTVHSPQSAEQSAVRSSQSVEQSTAHSPQSAMRESGGERAGGKSDSSKLQVAGGCRSEEGNTYE
jgi:hypothetical protein